MNINNFIIKILEKKFSDYNHQLNQFIFILLSMIKILYIYQFIYKNSKYKNLKIKKFLLTKVILIIYLSNIIIDILILIEKTIILFKSKNMSENFIKTKKIILICKGDSKNKYIFYEKNKNFKVTIDKDFNITNKNKNFKVTTDKDFNITNKDFFNNRNLCIEYIDNNVFYIIISKIFNILTDLYAIELIILNISIAILYIYYLIVNYYIKKSIFIDLFFNENNPVIEKSNINPLIDNQLNN
jgi:hypothetical protein